MAKLNWRQILIHFFACWFFLYSFQGFFFLFDIELLNAVRQYDESNPVQALSGFKKTVSEFSNSLFWISISGFIGLMVAFVISLSISFYRHWYWVNSVLVFILAYIGYHFNLFAGLADIYFFNLPAQLIIKDFTLRFMLKGLILLSIGLILFFTKRITNFIENRRLASG